jgi:hypothetical protein
MGGVTKTLKACGDEKNDELMTMANFAPITNAKK